jgi:hypothetical protein
MDADLTLDGNALGGVLQDVFAAEMTASAGCCGGCGAVEAVGALTVHLHAPGTVVRCPHCASVVLRIVWREDRYLLDLSGLRWLELRPSP